MHRLWRELAALNQDMREIDRPMRDLGEETAVLGRHMEVPGVEMDDAWRRAHAGMRTLVDRAITPKGATCWTP
jgi:hypothetical protein